MKDDMDHTEISERLLAYARDELDARDRGLVQEHLESCELCRLELASIELVLEKPAPLTPREQRRLHAAVAREIEPREPVVIGGRWSREGWARRFAPTLGAAALLLIVAVIGLSGLSGGGDDALKAPSLQEDAGGAGEAGGGGDEKLEEKKEQPGGAPAPESADDGEDSAGFEAPEPKPSFDSSEATQTSELAAKGRTVERLYEEFATAFTFRQAERNEARFVRLLARKAPGELRGQVADCGNEVRERRDEPVLAAYGTVTRQDGERGLALSFVYAKSPTGHLTDYMVWTWPLGSCSDELNYTSRTLDD